MKIYYSPKCLEYSQPGHPESPGRIRSTYEYLEEKGYEFEEPDACTDEDILLAHSPKLLESIRKGSFFDFDTPAYPGIYEIAKISAGAAIQAALYCREKRGQAFSLMRPPGHHAGANELGGFCYFNNIVIASLKSRSSNASRVAIIDFDCHHGNGTENIIVGKADFLYLSLHQSPLYPGSGLKNRDNCINYPLSPDTSPEHYLSVLNDGLKKVKKFNPDLIAVSAGFDSYKLDPITNLTLELPTYHEIGRMIAGLGKPAFAVLEGGYSGDLRECVYQFLTGMES